MFLTLAFHHFLKKGPKSESEARFEPPAEHPNGAKESNLRCSRSADGRDPVATDLGGVRLEQEEGLERPSGEH